MSENEKKTAEETGVATLSDENLDKMSGGYIFQNSEGDWAVIDEDGKEVALLDDEDEAIAEAARRGLSTEEIEWSELRKKRGIKFVW